MNFLIIDDHKQVREGLNNLLRAEFPFASLYEAANGIDALQIIATTNLHFILLDLSMPGVSGLTVLNKIRQKESKVPVLIISIGSEDQYADPLINAGANGYINKELLNETLIPAIRSILNGKIYVSNSDPAPDKEDQSASPEKIIADLSARELSILRLIATGKNEEFIAQELALNPRSVSSYIQLLLKKLQASSNSELATIYERYGPTQ